MITQNFLNLKMIMNFFYKYVFRYFSVGAITAIVTNNGGVMCEKFPEKKNFNIGSHPYLHAHLGPLFVIHDGKVYFFEFAFLQ